MRKIIEVDKFFVNSVFFMKKTCFFFEFQILHFKSSYIFFVSVVLVPDPGSSIQRMVSARKIGVDDCKVTTWAPLRSGARMRDLLSEEE